jgi:hypothetical protein
VVFGYSRSATEYPKTTPRHPVLVFDGFVTDCFERLIDTAGCPIRN